jgi:predicted esterase
MTIQRLGPAPREARLALVMAHGRGSAADDMIALARQIAVADVACIAPEAPGHTWYPYSFLAPIEQNEPHLSAALATLDTVVNELLQGGLAAERIALIGFSQGACLSLEYAARHPRRYAAVMGLSGGLIGPPGTPRDYPGSFEGTPVFLGCSDVDPHIPLGRFQESAEVLRRMQAAVDARVYPGMGHTVNRDELDAVSALLRGVE